MLNSQSIGAINDGETRHKHPRQIQLPTILPPVLVVSGDLVPLNQDLYLFVSQDRGSYMHVTLHIYSHQRVSFCSSRTLQNGFLCCT